MGIKTLEADISCARSPVSCKICESKLVCQMYKSLKNALQVLDTFWEKELKGGDK